MIIINNIVKIIQFINNWQKENDFDFKVIPIDEHSNLIFNHGNQEYKFIFSNKYKRDECRLNIPVDLIENYQYIMEQEDGYTYYLFTKGDY